MLDRPLRVYVAGPYSAKTEEGIEMNVQRAIVAGIAILLKGHYPYIPHLTHYVDKVSKPEGMILSWEDHLDWGLAWLESSDGILYLGSSKGARIELQYAKKLGKRVFRKVEDVPNLVRKHHKIISSGA